MSELRAYGYQLIPLTKLLTNQQNAVLICDGVGVGKTISAGYIISFLSAQFSFPALVICPPGLVDKWYLELRERFRQNAIPIRSGEELFFAVDYWNSPSKNPRTYILPSSLLSHTDGHHFLGPVIVDEIHNYRNRDTQAWAALKSLIEKSSHRVGLSATPINNDLSDLAAELSILLNVNIHVADALVQELWTPAKNKILFALITRFLKDRLGIHFARRDVRDVRISFPDSYRSQVRTIVKSLRNRPNNEKMHWDEITYFRLAASSPQAFSASTGMAVDSVQEKNEAMQRILEENMATQVILFCEFEETARHLSEQITSRTSFVITGSVPVFQREEILQRFREEPNGVLIMTSVGAEGIDLQFCSVLINYDLNWNPMVLEQRIGRIDRIGQKKSRIKIYNFVVDGSIDDRIIQTLGRKLGLLEGSVLDPATVLGSATSTSSNLFLEDDFEEEGNRANLLAEALKLSSSMSVIPEDYQLIEAIDTSFCDPRKLVDSTLLPTSPAWLREMNIATAWKRQMTEQSGELSRLIVSYSD